MRSPPEVRNSKSSMFALPLSVASMRLESRTGRLTRMESTMHSRMRSALSERKGFRSWYVRAFSSSIPRMTPPKRRRMIRAINSGSLGEFTYLKLLTKQWETKWAESHKTRRRHDTDVGSVGAHTRGSTRSVGLFSSDRKESIAEEGSRGEARRVESIAE